MNTLQKALTYWIPDAIANGDICQAAEDLESLLRKHGDSRLAAAKIVNEILERHGQDAVFAV